MNKKRTALLLLPALLIIFAVALTACNLFGGATTVTITFVSNGGSACEPMTINEGDVFTKDDFPVPTRSGYTFGGWYIDKDFKTTLIDFLINNTVKKSFNAYAKWISEAKNVWVLKNAEGGDVTGEGKYSEGETVTLTATVTEPDYHLWEGWYDEDNNLLHGFQTYTFTMGLEAKIIYARWICLVSSDAVFYRNYDEEDATELMRRGAGYRENNIQIDVPTRQNYYFAGWNTERDGSGITISDERDRSLINNYPYKTETAFYAIWTINTYSADNVDSTSVKITAYNGSESLIFLPDVLDGKTVVSLGGLANGGVREMVIPYTVTEVAENALPAGIEKVYLAPGSELSPTDEAFADAEVYINVVNYDAGQNVNYYCYMDGIFADTELDDEAEHKAFFKYLRLYNITDHFQLHCNYNTGVANLSAFNGYCSSLLSTVSLQFKSNLENSYTIQPEKKSGANPYYVTYKFTLKSTEISSLTSGGGAMQTQGTPAYLNYGAAAGEHTFAIDSLSPIAVYNSEQLVSAVERGFKPIFPQAGTTAEECYVAARTALATFIEADMTDLEKVNAIHDYLALNVVYDTWVFSNSTALETNGTINEYRAFFLEGALLDNKAVCDGIAKAFMLMCRMEGIETVRVSGDSYSVVGDLALLQGRDCYYYDSSDNILIKYGNYTAASDALSAGVDVYTKGAGHAWNKVFLNGQWYCVDVTKDDAQIDNSGTKYEFLSHIYFMRSDSELVRLGNLATDGTSNQYPATADYDYYSATEYNPGATLAPSTDADYTALASYLNSAIGSESGLYSLDFYSTNGNALTVMSNFGGGTYTQQKYGAGFVYVVMKFK